MWACPAEVPGSTAAPALPAQYMTRALGLTARAWNGISISRRISDGYVNATAMCQAGGKKWNDYFRLARTQDYIAALAAVAGNPATGNAGLILVIQGGQPHLQGTWIHPRLAIDLARWISAPFAVWMDGWLLEEMAHATQPAQPRARRRTTRAQQARTEEEIWWDQATVPQRHAHMLAHRLEAAAKGQSKPHHQRLIHHSCQRIMEAFPLPTVADQLAPVVDLLRTAADQLERVSVSQ
jgi:FAD/FMN-containing dehydrogenase